MIEMAHGYGFVGVFVTALTLRSAERGSDYHTNLHDFAEQIERLLMMVVLVCFGAAIAEGTVFRAFDWRVAAVALTIIFLVRPAAGWLGLIGSEIPGREKAVIAIFGIRGLGSFYYMAYATGSCRIRQTRCPVGNRFAGRFGVHHRILCINAPIPSPIRGSYGSTSMPRRCSSFSANSLFGP